MKKRIIKISVVVASILLVIGICWILNGIVGNPVSRALAKRTAEQHLAEQYEGEGFVVERVTFSFKSGEYYAYVADPDSIDRHFTLSIRWNGELLSDDYEYRIADRSNTAHRIGETYRLMAKDVFDSESFPYDEHIGHGELLFVGKEYENDPDTREYAIRKSELVLDAEYDANAFGATSGLLTVYIESDTVNAELLSQILLNIRHAFDEANVSFHVIDCVLEHPLNEDGSRDTERVEVMEFLYDDIREDGLLERVVASNEAAKAYYAEQDALK